MDERERRDAVSRRTGSSGTRRRRPDGSAQRPEGRSGQRPEGGYGTGRQRPGTRYSASNRKRPGGRGSDPNRQSLARRSSRARRRRRNTVIRWLLLIVLIIAAAGGFLIWQRYGSSNEKADLEQYYELEAENDIAVVINNEVVRRSDGAEDGQTEDAPAPGKIYDGQYYIEYSVVRDRINKRFYWDSNENVLLYTLPEGSVR